MEWIFDFRFRRSCTGESTSTAKRAHGEAHVPLRRKSCVRTEPEGGPPAIRKDLKRTSYDCQAFRTSPRGVRISEGVQDWLHRFVWQNDRATEAPSHFAFPFRRGALASEATFLTPAHQPKTEKNRERKRQRANRAGVGEKSQRRVADYPLHRLSNQPVFQTEIPPTASVQRTDRAKKKALLRRHPGR